MALLDEQDGDLVVFWKGVSGITDLVGSGGSARIWPEQAKEGKSPAFIVYLEAGGGSRMHLGGISGLRETVVHVYCYGATAKLARRLRELVKVHTQPLTQTTIGGSWIDSVAAIAIDSGVENLADNSKRYWARLVLQIQHDEAVAA